MNGLATTWWGHSSVTVELGPVRVATDPLFSRQLVHLRRASPAPPAQAAAADVVLVSHLHHDHLHVPSLRRFAPGVPIVVPRGTPAALPALRRLPVIEAEPGDVIEVAGIRASVLPAHHDGRRHTLSRRNAPALGFRLEAGGYTCWYPGDTGWFDGLADLDPVDLALVPIGGWGPTLDPEDHFDPEQAATAVAKIGARWALAVHYGTFWPLALRTLHRANYRWLFESPAQRFIEAVVASGTTAQPLTPAFGERLQLA